MPKLVEASWASYTLALWSAVAAIACDGDVPPPAKSSGGTGGQAGGPPAMSECEGPELAMPKRLVRLSFPQVAQSMGDLLGEELGAMVRAKVMAPATTERTFPPLGDTSEGSTYIDAKWQSADDMASVAGKYVLDRFGPLTGCGESPTPQCAEEFLGGLAAKAFRRPLDEREATSLLQVYSEAVGIGSTVQEGVEASVYAIFSAPQFLYRSELGADASTGALSSYEVASQLSYFLTDGPPDASLLEAAAENALSSPEEIGAHVDRLLSSPRIRQNLSDTIVSALGIARVKHVIIDGLPPDDFNSGVANSMFRETELFIQDVLWNGGTVAHLVTSRGSFINASLAPLYGVEMPEAVDQDGFGFVWLPEHRSGLLTSLGFLTSRSRPDQQSVVGRGLAVNDAVLCQENPAFPEALADVIDGVSEEQESYTERERADYRGRTPPCLGCHQSFDPYGVALENFDIIGRFRTEDEHGNAIDASVVLPAVAEGRTAANAVEVGRALAETGAFANCVASKLLTYALAETGVSGNSCAARSISNQYRKSDQSFSSLVREVAMSKAFTHRSGG